MIMKRSQINNWIREAIAFFDEYKWHLPPFAFYTPKEWQEIIRDPEKMEKCKEIIDKGLGWDVPDFGRGDFESFGLFLFTLRNGDLNATRNYAEKLMISRENQVCPWHFHWDKAEDIINRGGGNLIIEIYNASSEDTLQPGEPWVPGVFDEVTPVKYFHDGIWDEIAAGEKIVLHPGESISVTSANVS